MNKENINLSTEHWNYLIKNSDLNKKTIYDEMALQFAIRYMNITDLSVENWKYLIDNSNISIITDKEQLIEIKKIQTKLLNDEILNKIDMKKEKNKINKI